MGVGSAIDITTGQRRTILTLLERNLPGTTAWAYGSRAKWTSRPQSDLDLVIFSKPEQKHLIGNLREALDESDLPFHVDLFVWDEVPESFRKQIEAEHIVLVEPEKLTAGHKWPKFRLGDCIEKNDASYSPTETWSCINYLDTSSITENRIAEVQHFSVVTDAVPSRAKRKAKQGDIVYSMVRPNQRHFGVLKNVPENFLVSTGFFVFSGKYDVSHTDFIYWFLVQDSIIERLQVIAEHSTSAYPAIRPSDIEDLEIYLPPLPEQRAIAHILGTLDDKIELNRRMNEILEAMAQAIFKDWFVDFGPTRAKMEGREPYLSSDIWDLFPDVLDDKGKPLGWQTYTLSDLAHHHSATASPSAEPERIFEHYSIPAYDAANEPSFDTGSSIKSNKTIVPEGAVLLTKLNPEIERVWLPNPKREVPQIASTEFLTFTPHQPATCSILYCLFRTSSFRRGMVAMVTGTSKSHQRVQPKALLPCEVLVADPRLFDSFDQAVCIFFDRLLSNRREKRILAQTRDMLLPKLMSGEIRLREAEKVVEALV